MESLQVELINQSCFELNNCMMILLLIIIVIVSNSSDIKYLDLWAIKNENN